MGIENGTRRGLMWACTAFSTARLFANEGDGSTSTFSSGDGLRCEPGGKVTGSFLSEFVASPAGEDAGERFGDGWSEGRGGEAEEGGASAAKAISLKMPENPAARSTVLIFILFSYRMFKANG